jgi:alkylhydroperoxidase family enzyme
LEKEQMHSDFQTLFQKMEDRGNKVLNVFRVLAHCPNVGRDTLRLGNSILLKGKVNPRLRELAILRVGNLLKANYEATHHMHVARRVGVPQDQIDAVRDWSSSDLFNEQERAVLQYTDEVTNDVRVSDETVQALRAFLNEEQTVELTIAIGYYGMMSRVLESLQIELESP